MRRGWRLRKDSSVFSFRATNAALSIKRLTRRRSRREVLACGIVRRQNIEQFRLEPARQASCASYAPGAEAHGFGDKSRPEGHGAARFACLRLPSVISRSTKVTVADDMLPKSRNTPRDAASVGRVERQGAFDRIEHGAAAGMYRPQIDRLDRRAVKDVA